MTQAFEFFGVFVAGIAFTLIVLAVSAKPLMRWSMRRAMENAVKKAAGRDPILPSGPPEDYV